MKVLQLKGGSKSVLPISALAHLDVNKSRNEVRREFELGPEKI